MEKYEQNFYDAYPAIKVEGKNLAYARMMLSNLGGVNSEMSAVGLYFYDHLILGDDSDLSKLFIDVAKVEMHHLDIFGSLARKLGADPRLWASNGGGMAYWSPKYLQYKKDRYAILHGALEAEQKAIEKYEKQLTKISDELIKEILKRIIKDEQAHVDMFKKALAQ